MAGRRSRCHPGLTAARPDIAARWRQGCGASRGYPWTRRPGNTAAPTIAGSVDADRDGHAEIFVKVDSGASTQFWTIFKLVGRQIRQVTSQGQPVRLAVNGTLTHQDGFRCDGAQFVTVSEATEPPGDGIAVQQATQVSLLLCVGASSTVRSSAWPAQKGREEGGVGVMPGLGHNWLRQGYCHGPFGLSHRPYAAEVGVDPQESRPAATLRRTRLTQSGPSISPVAGHLPAPAP